MKKINFIVHIPKTAGTSFRHALQQNKSVRMLYDYGKEFHESTPALLEINPRELTPESAIFDARKFNFICGHVNYRKYARCVSQDAVVSIVRNPVERVVSEYQHVKRHGGYPHSFAEFASTSVQQDKQCAMLKGLNQKHGALIGLTSHYRYFVEMFSSRVGLPLEPVFENRAPKSDAEDRINIPPGEIKSAFLCNKKDMKLFFEKACGFSKLVQSAGYNTIPPEGAKWNCRIAGHDRLVGWLPCTAKDCYFVTIDVNGEKRVVVSLDQNREDIHGKGLSENPVCGFSYPLALLGVEKGDEVSVGVLGAPGFTRTLHVDWER